MSVLRERFAAVKAQKRCGSIPFIVAGDPNLGATTEILCALSKLEPLAIEVGVPFSDPTADGPVIQRAAQRSLSNGTTLERVLQMLLRRQRLSELAPIILFTYYNPLLQFGLAKFARRAARCDVAGVLVVDLPAEAAAPLHHELRRRGIDLIFLVAPTTNERRLKQIARIATGFIYVVSRTGVTGTARELADESRKLVERIRAVSELPIAVGFGITNRTQARPVCRYADAVVVGSRFVAEIEAIASANHPDQSNLRDVVVQCAREFTDLGTR